MNSKQSEPDCITMEQNSSGTWEVPRKPRFRLQAWQRLWIVTGMVWLLMLGGTCYLIMPTRDSIESRMVFDVTEELRRYDGMAFAGESPRNIFMAARSKGYESWIAEQRGKYRVGPQGNQRFDKLWNAYQEDLSSLSFKQILGIFFCAVAWGVPMGVLYFIGRVIEWIQRGIRGEL